MPHALKAALAASGLGDAHLEPVWKNSAGGLTFAVSMGDRTAPAAYFAKWNPAGSGESLSGEAERLRWMRGRHPVPEVVDLIHTDAEEVLMTRALPGTSAVAEPWRATPEVALRALGRGLRQLHSVAIDDCPFRWGVAQRSSVARLEAAGLGDPPRVDELVVCQGDPCAPNTLLSADGNFLAHVDLGRLGVADRWADLAVMSMSLRWNYPRFDESVFWRAYGVEPDEERIAFYRSLWNLE